MRLFLVTATHDELSSLADGVFPVMHFLREIAIDCPFVKIGTLVLLFFRFFSVFELLNFFLELFVLVAH
jgi:hypothetical protein